jgi:hypothetical protein
MHTFFNVNSSFAWFADIFVAQLAEAQRLQKEAEGKIAKIASHRMKEDDRQDIMTIPKPKGEAGDKKNGFNLRTAMQLEGSEQKEIYDAIQVCVPLSSPTRMSYILMLIASFCV